MKHFVEFAFYKQNKVKLGSVFFPLAGCFVYQVYDYQSQDGGLRRLDLQKKVLD